MNGAAPWYTSRVFIGLLVTFVTQILAVSGLSKYLAAGDVPKIVDAGLQLFAIASAAYALHKRQASEMQPLTLTQKGADEHPATAEAIRAEYPIKEDHRP